ncbi:MAG: helix-turn-helix transcriptional regulator [Alphaproteobacteria bacterium]|nr:helix-turn-helix transcriptional regulator [Alphaproteobacteria bacterium]
METPITAKAALLQALVKGPGFGLELIDRVQERTNGAVVLHQGSVYPALRKLEAEGLIESYEGEPMPERGGRPRRYYRLTAEGARAAMEQGTAVAGLFGLVPGVAGA